MNEDDTRILGDYRLLSKLGKGKAGVVYMATPLRAKPFARLGTPVALKVYKPEILQEALEAERIQTEASIGSEIAHPNLVRIYEHRIDKKANSQEIEQGLSSDAPWLSSSLGPR
jgi:serine/threonine protein kinase